MFWVTLIYTSHLSCTNYFVRTHLVHDVERSIITGHFRHRNIEVDADELVSVLLDDVIRACYALNGLPQRSLSTAK